MPNTNSSPFVSDLKIDPHTVPQHIAIIMDGNRRWAAKRGLPPTDGHKAGMDNLERIVEHAKNIGIKHITVYALSTENWKKRTVSEVKGIFDLLLNFSKTRAEQYKSAGVRFVVLGDFTAFPHQVKNAIRKILDMVLTREKIRLNVALNYGGRDEIINAIRRMISDKVKPSDVDEKLVSNYLYTAGQPDPELIIRPGGEMRVSNFLLWQLSYAELYFSDVLWPDFGPKELEKAIYWYQERDRRMGK